MRSRQLTTVHTDDVALTQIQSNVKKALAAASDAPFARSNRLENVSLISSQANVVNHGLVRTLKSWVIVRRRGGAAVWDEQDTNPSPDRTLILRCANDVVVDILVD